MGSSHDHAPVEVDPHAVRDAQNLWKNFTLLMTYSVGIVIVILALMAYFIA